MVVEIQQQLAGRGPLVTLRAPLQVSAVMWMCAQLCMGESWISQYFALSMLKINIGSTNKISGLQ